MPPAKILSLARDEVGADDIQVRPPKFSDDALALRFADRHAGDLRYVAVWGRWLSFTGSRWREDDTLLIFHRVRLICREAAAECDNPKVASAIASATTVAAVERLARSDRRIAATSEQWDADPMLLNAPDGVIDLSTGLARPHRSDDYMTEITAVSPGGNCPRFLAFLDRITRSDSGFVAYLQRALGYALTGLTREHALFFAFGTGANGKSVLISTIAGILGSYHKTAPIEAFTVSNSDRHPTELAGLQGARLVTATETEEGRKWAESRIKQLTGGDAISARFMRQDFFEFSPTFKILIAGNHKPSLRNVDEAIRRRFHFVPFSVTIPPNERDLELTDKLEAERSGILAWLIAGCLQWQKVGLQPPKNIVDATVAYLESEDAIAAWIKEKCECDPNAWASSSALFASWSAWAIKAGEFVGAQKKLTQALEARGFTIKNMTKARGLLGLRVLPDMPTQSD